MGDTNDVAAARERLADEAPEDVAFLAEAIAERRPVVYVDHPSMKQPAASHTTQDGNRAVIYLDCGKAAS